MDDYEIINLFYEKNSENSILAIQIFFNFYQNWTFYYNLRQKFHYWFQKNKFNASLRLKMNFSQKNAAIPPRQVFQESV